MSYPPEFITLNLVILVTTTQATVIDQLWKVLLDELLDLGYGLFQASLASACNVEVKRRVLRQSAPVEIA